MRSTRRTTLPTSLALVVVATLAVAGGVVAGGKDDTEMRWKRPPVSPEVTPEQHAAVLEFAKVWRERRLPFGNKWFGIPTIQNPLDVWVTQEIMFEVEPDFIVETGTFAGGSALVWATILEQINPEGRIITIDIENRSMQARQHPIAKRRVEFLLGSSTDPKIVEHVAQQVKGKRVIVILDSLHTRKHVLQELRMYAPLVNVGSYLIVQDTGVAETTLGIGWAGDAVREFMQGNRHFETDHDRERLLITNNSDGFLKRVR